MGASAMLKTLFHQTGSDRLSAYKPERTEYRFLNNSMNKKLPLYAGFSRVDITPAEPVGMELAGMPRLYPGALGVLDPLSARACYLECGKNRFLMIVCDICLTDALAPHHEEVIKKLARRFSIPAKNIWIVATHCHSSIGETLWRAPTPFMAKVFSRYLDTLVPKLIQVGSEAVTGKQQVQIGYGQTEIHDVAASRRVKISDGTVVTGWGDGPSAPPGVKTVGRGIHDPELGVILFKNLRGQPVGALLNYNSHIHTSPMQYFSAELAGYTCHLLEKKLKGVTAVYTNGAQGDTSLCANTKPFSRNPKQWTSDYLDGMHRMSRILVNGALRVVKRMAFERTATMCLAEKRLPIDQWLTPATVLPITSYKPGAQEVLSGVSINGMALIGQPEEMFVEFALALKKASPFPSTFVIGMNAPRNFYLPTTSAWEEGGYEPGFFLKPGSFEQATDEAIALLKRMHKKIQ